MIELTDTTKRFINTLKKPHNYERIVSNYLKYCIENDLYVNIKSKELYLQDRAAVYKTGLNKFFTFLGKDLDVKVYLDAKITYLVDKQFYKGLAESTIKVYNQTLQTYFTNFGENLDISEAESFLKELDSKTIETYNFNHSILKRWFQFNNIYFPLKPKKQAKAPTLKTVLNDSQIEKVFSYIVKNESKQLVCIFGLMMYNGLRSIDVIRFRKENNKYYSVIKGNVEVEIKVSEIIKPIMDLYFSNRNTFEYTCTSSLRKQTKRIILECLGKGFEKVSPHSFRHSLAVNETKKGTDFREIRGVLNHKSFDSTAHYTQDKY